VFGDLSKIIAELESNVGELTRAAASLASKISAAQSPEALRALAQEAGGLVARMASLGVDIPLVSSLAALLSDQDSNIDLSQNAEELSGAMYAASTPMEKAIVKHMTDQEKNFLQSIDPKKEYDTFKLGKDGKFLLDEKGQPIKEGTIKGTEVREAFTNIKEHALDENKRDEVRKEAGLAAAGKEPDAIEKDMETLDASLDKTERFHMGELHRKGKHARAEHDHKNFEKAHDRVGRVRECAGKCREHRHDPAQHAEAQQDLKKAQTELKEVLQKDIIDDTLTKDMGTSKQHDLAKAAGAVDVKWTASHEFRSEATIGTPQTDVGRSV